MTKSIHRCKPVLTSWVLSGLVRPADCEPIFLTRWLVLPKQQEVVHDGDSDTKSIFKAQDTCMCAKSLQLCLNFSALWTVARQGPPSMKFSRQEYWSGLPFLSLGDLPNPESLEPPSLAGRFFPTAPPGKTHCKVLGCTV